MEMRDLINENLNIGEGWQVTDDLKADWAIDKIKEVDAEFKRFEIVAKNKISQIQDALQVEQEKADRERSFFESKLREYFEGVKFKETKTQQSYKLPSGTLKMKKAKIDFDYDKKKLLEVAEKTQMVDYIKIKKDFDWAEFKKTLQIKGTAIIDKETGEFVEIEGLGTKEKPEEFKVVL